jgi:hypothetical protein
MKATIAVFALGVLFGTLVTLVGIAIAIRILMTR